MLSKEQKKEIVSALAEELKKARGAIFSDFKGLPTKDIQEVRAKLRQEGVAYKVVKITLLKRALRLAGVDTKGLEFSAPLSVAWSATDEVTPAKILSDFAKKNENLRIVSGVLESKVVDASQIKMLASLPSKQELYGQFVSVVAGPMRGLVTVMSGNIRGFVNVLNAVKETKS